MSTIRARVTIATHRGMVREHNEDAVGLNGWSLRGELPVPLTFDFSPTQPLTVVVCDGMGGHRGGASASALAAELITAAPPASPGQGAERFRVAVQAAAEEILRRSAADRALSGMGCTVVGLAVDPGSEQAVIFHVGDSRAYALDEGYLARQTRDDRRNADQPVLTQALGGGQAMQLDVHVRSLPLAPGARLLLCTDGLVDLVEDREIEAAMSGDAGAVVGRLIDLACRAGGHDNISVALIDLLAAEPAPGIGLSGSEEGMRE